MNHSRKQTLIAIAAVVVLTAGCAKKKVAAAPPPPVAPSVAPATSPRSTPQPERTATNQPRVTTPSASRLPDAATRARIDQLLAKIEDAYFDYDKSTLRPDAMKVLQADSAELRDILKDYPDYHLTIEGHADERGSAEYNLGLGDRRAGAAKDYLVGIGIPADQLSITSYGKERPVCQDDGEACWQRNRRIHIVAAAKP